MLRDVAVSEGKAAKVAIVIQPKEQK